VNTAARRITFDADTGNATYYLDVRTYSLYDAAADVWQMKAAFVHDAVDWQSDNHTVSAEQEYQHCLEMARQFRNRAGARVARMVRTDETA
jgi:hypothetical protein